MDNAISVLGEFIILEMYREKYGEDDYYKTERAELMQKAKRVYNESKHSAYPFR